MIDDASKAELVVDVAREMYPTFTLEDSCDQWQLDNAEHVVNLVLGRLTEIKPTDIGTERVDASTALEKAVDRHDPINSVKRSSFRAGWYAALKHVGASR